MHRSFVAELVAQRATIKQAWERKLRQEPITSPLANPDTLVLLMDHTLDALEAALSARCQSPDPTPSTERRMRPWRTGCLCGLNPLLAYFRVAAHTIPAVLRPSSSERPSHRSPAFAGYLSELNTAIQQLAAAEIRTFCATCQTDLMRGGRMATWTRSAITRPVRQWKTKRAHPPALR